MKQNEPKEMIENAIKAAIWDGYSVSLIKEIVKDTLKNIFEEEKELKEKE